MTTSHCDVGVDEKMKVITSYVNEGGAEDAASFSFVINVMVRTIKVLSQILNLIQSNYAYSCLGFRKLYNVLLPCFSREASRQMTDIETFFSKQM